MRPGSWVAAAGIFHCHSKREIGDVPLSARSHVACVSNPGKMGLNGQGGICMGRAPDWREMADRTADRQTSQREDVEHQTCW